MLFAARDLVAAAGSASTNSYIQIQYDSETYTTSRVYNTAAPIWNEIFVFEENTSMLTRRLRVEAWSQRGVAPGRGATSEPELIGSTLINLDLATESAVQVSSGSKCSRAYVEQESVFCLQKLLVGLLYKRNDTCSHWAAASVTTADLAGILQHNAG